MNIREARQGEKDKLNLYGRRVVTSKPSSIHTDWQWCNRKISSKQMMQRSRKSFLIPFSATRCNLLREADMAAGVMSVGGFVPHPTHRRDASMCTNYGSTRRRSHRRSLFNMFVIHIKVVWTVEIQLFTFGAFLVNGVMLLYVKKSLACLLNSASEAGTQTGTLLLCTHRY